MSKTSAVLWRIAGGVIGSLVVGFLLYLWGREEIAGIVDWNNEDYLLAMVITFGGPVFGAIIGAPLGATAMQKLLRQRSSFWIALLAALLGLLVGVLPMALCCSALYQPGRWRDAGDVAFVGVAIECAAVIAGAVIGSGWKAKPAGKAQS
jgi:hypothetical protein